MPDQLDVQITLAKQDIRRMTNDARRRLGIPPRNYTLDSDPVIITSKEGTT